MKLNKGELKLVKSDARYGLELLRNIKDPPQSAEEIVYQHQEKLDGTGYPQGKKGGEISEYAKIASMADAFYIK